MFKMHINVWVKSSFNIYAKNKFDISKTNVDNVGAFFTAKFVITYFMCHKINQICNIRSIEQFWYVRQINNLARKNLTLATILLVSKGFQSFQSGLWYILYSEIWHF